MRSLNPRTGVEMTPNRRDEFIRVVSDYHALSVDEMIVYAALFDAAERNAPCPTGEDLNELTGYSSDSASRNQVARLEKKGLIFVRLASNRRVVKIAATGRETFKPANFDEIEKTRVPRGTHDPVPLRSSLQTLSMLLTCRDHDFVGPFDPLEAVDSLSSLLRLEKAIVRSHELINRRKGHFLLTPVPCSQASVGEMV